MLRLRTAYQARGRLLVVTLPLSARWATISTVLTRIVKQPVGIALMAAGVAGVVGSFAPWARIHGLLDVSGTVYGNDGTIDADGGLTATLMGVIILAGLAIILTAGQRKWPCLVALSAAVVAGFTASIDRADIANGAGSIPATHIEPSWGVSLVAVAAGFSIVLALVNLSPRPMTRGKASRPASRQSW